MNDIKAFDDSSKAESKEYITSISPFQNSILILGLNGFDDADLLEIDSALLDQSFFTKNHLKDLTTKSTNNDYVSVFSVELSNCNSSTTNEEKIEDTITWNNSNSIEIGTVLKNGGNEITETNGNGSSIYNHNQEEALDLSLPKISKPIEEITPKRTNNFRKKLMESGVKDLQKEIDFQVLFDNILEDDVSDDDFYIPDDLPDLRRSFILRGKPSVSRRTKQDNWVISVRRRVTPISTIRNMFGLKDENAPLILLADGIGVRNPLESNIPTSSIRPDKGGTYNCLYCRTVCSGRKGLARHLLGHTTFKQCFCVVCWKGFYDTHDLKRHSRLHQDISIFYCELCKTILTQNVTKESHLSKIHDIHF